MANNYGTFVGKLKKPTGDKVQFVAPSKKNDNVLLLNATFESGTNKVFVKMMGFKQDKIRVYLNKTETMEVDWDNRFDENILEKAPNYAKTTINIGDGRKEFLSDWDAIKYLEEKYDEYKDKKIVLSIKYDKNPYNGKINDQYSITGVYLAKEDQKDRLGLRPMFYWNKDSVDDADWNSNHVLYINGYIKSYFKDDKKDDFFEQTVALDCSKIDFENEHDKALVDYRLKYFKTKSSTYLECPLDTVLIIGAEKKDDDEFDESMLTDVQKEQIALGLKTINDFKTGGSYYGDFKTEVKLIDFNFTGNYSNGPVDTGMTQEELEAAMYHAIDPDETFVDIDGAANNILDDLFV